MRLLNTRTGEFKWVEDPRQEHYAVLSHVWAKENDPDGQYPEQTYQDLLELQKEERPEGTLPSKLSDKLKRFCETASKDGFELGWADTCCIDKTSSSELSEAINSMYNWYAYSGACYAFLRDVTSPNEDSRKWLSAFEGSEWFKRGWTLQELIASRIVIFISKGWEVLGSKHSLAACISSVTGIDIGVLTFEKSLEEIPVARRMSWAQSRKTSRLEDEAYCLMGIFSVNMQTNYGEGRYAFIRLQEKILLQSSDQTIFAWGRFFDDPSLTLLPSNSTSIPAASMPSNLSHTPIAPPSFLKQYLLAPSPQDFDPSRTASMVRLSREMFQDKLGVPITEDLYQVFNITPYGLRTSFPLLNVASSEYQSTSATHCAILACEDPDKGLLVLLLRPRKHLTGNEFFAGAIVTSSQQKSGGEESFSRDPLLDHYWRLTYITTERLKSLHANTVSASTFTLYRRPLPPMLTVSSVYTPHCPSRSAIELDRDSGIHAVLCEMSEKFEVEFCRWSKNVLERDGYRVSWGSSSESQDKPSKPFATSKSVLDRNPSAGGKNSVTISNVESDVELIIQTGICSCEFAQRTGNVIGILVSSRDADSLDRTFPSRDHVVDHPIHVRSWSFDHGFASREIEFDSPKDPARRLSLRLTFTSLASPQGSTSSVRRYRLGAELRERNSSELQHPRQPLPLNPTSARLASNPSPPQSLHESTVGAQFPSAYLVPRCPSGPAPSILVAISTVLVEVDGQFLGKQLIMRLLNTRTGEFKWVEDHRREHYAILSHVWARPDDSENREQTYEDLVSLQKEASAKGICPIDHADFSDKIRRFCETALKDGFELGWADTCCIDKTSSSELSEAINSMYNWYAYSDVCYAFLHDVTSRDEDFAFKASKWFQRGWTLQELIASRMLIFLSKGWEVLGSKHSMAACVSSVTGIDIGVLTFETSLEEIPVARRMSWAQSRRTTRIEDEAYCLMGIFGVNMQTNYGEGQYAFIRLQEKIISQSPDQTIFAWGRFLDETSMLTFHLPSSPTISVVNTRPDPTRSPVAPSLSPEQCLLALSPRNFDPGLATKLVCLSREEFRERLGLPITDDLYQIFEITPYGLRGQLPLVGVSPSRQTIQNDPTHCAILACENPNKGLLVLFLQSRGHGYTSSDHEYIAGGTFSVMDWECLENGMTPVWINCHRHCRLTYIQPKQLMSLCTPSITSTPPPDQPLVLPGVTVSNVYIPHCQSRSAFKRDRDSDIHRVLGGTFGRYMVEFCPLSQRVLELDGYRVSLHSSQPQESDEPLTDSPTLIRNLPASKFNSGTHTIVTISGKFGIDLTVRVGHCSCNLGQCNGILCVLVSSNVDAESLDRRFPSHDHTWDHTLHVHSWSFDHGSASRRIEFHVSDSEDSRKFCLRLTLTSFASRRGATPAVRRYRLGADLCEMDPSTQSLSDSESSSSQCTDSRHSSSDSLPTFYDPSASDSTPSSGQNEASLSDNEARPVLPAPHEPVLADDGRQLVGKGSAQTIGLMALGGLMTFALLSLNRYFVR